jgi:hypothetical protein
MRIFSCDAAFGRFSLGNPQRKLIALGRHADFFLRCDGEGPAAADFFLRCAERITAAWHRLTNSPSCR